MQDGLIEPNIDSVFRDGEVDREILKSCPICTVPSTKNATCTVTLDDKKTSQVLKRHEYMAQQYWSICELSLAKQM